MGRSHRCWYALLMLLLAPRIASAIQLHWNDGTTALSFTEATRCTLVVQADSLEQRLPSEWRLLWVADSTTDVSPIPLGQPAACVETIAQASAVDEPATAADSAAHLRTAHFCSDEGEPAATQARYVVDLPAGSAGNLKVVALDPNDSTQVIESNEVTFNGGVIGEYPPVVLRASSVHQSLQLKVTVLGAGLGATDALSIMAPDSTWSLPLTVTSRTDGAVTGVASVAALLPECEVSVGTEGGVVSSASLAADEEPAMLEPEGCQSLYNEDLLRPAPTPLAYTILPKDFALVRGFVDNTTNRFALHLFYIRRNLWYGPVTDPTEKNFGHIWTTDFETWEGPEGVNKPDTSFFAVRPGTFFDSYHVWAPHIVQRGPIFTMFYAGVDNSGGVQHQRIGIATSTDLRTWTRSATHVLDAVGVEWARKAPDGPWAGTQPLRDPFVMEDPVHPGQWLMYFVAVDSLRSPQMVVGVARSDGDFTSWRADREPLRSTQRLTSVGLPIAVESPHVFRRNGQWWMPYTINHDPVFFETTAHDDPAEADTTVAVWTQPIWLLGVTQGRPTELNYWHATEYLRINSTEYLAAYTDGETAIEIKQMFPAANPALDSLRMTCPGSADVPDPSPRYDAVRMAIVRPGGPASEVVLRLGLPERMRVRLAVYDIAGRRRATLLDQELPAGATDVMWRGRDEAGGRVASGVYFARLTCAKGARVSKLIMLR